MPIQKQPGRRLFAPIILTSVIVFLNAMIFSENVRRFSAPYGDHSAEVLPYYFGLAAAVVAWCSGLLAVLRLPAAATVGLVGAAVLFLVPLRWSHWGGDMFLLWWFVFSAACSGLAWFSWMGGRSAPTFVGELGGLLERWRSTVRLVRVLQWVGILGTVALSLALVVTWGFAVAMVWTLGCLLATLLVLQGIRTVRMRRLGLSPEHVRELERQLRAARGGPAKP